MKYEIHKYSVKIEKYRNKRYYTARTLIGKIASRILVKGSEINLDSARVRMEQNGTLRKGQKAERTDLTNFKEYTITKKSSLENRNKPVKLKKPPIDRKSGKKQILMYQVRGYIGKTLIVANSMANSNRPAREMKEEAWDNFEKLVTKHYTKGYDSDEGLKYLDNVTNIREGWVKYNGRRPQA